MGRALANRERPGARALACLGVGAAPRRARVPESFEAAQRTGLATRLRPRGHVALGGALRHLGAVGATLILGGGFGGQACARSLRRLLPSDHRITLVDRERDFVVGAAKTWVMLGERSPGEATQPRAALLPPGVPLLGAEARPIDPARHEVETTRGRLKADHLVIALGAEVAMDGIPGLPAAAHSFYRLPEALRLREALSAFAGGDVVI